MSVRNAIVTILVMFMLVISACNNIPDHVNYIPKDATLVVGINTVALGKKIAWDAIWGSKLLDEMKKEMDKGNVMKDFDKSGIKQLTTYYLYTKKDKRYEGGQKITAIIPLDDSKTWETYVKKMAPDAIIRDTKNRKEALFNNAIYAGWSADLLILTNTIHIQQDNPLENLNTEDPATVDSILKVMHENRDKVDEAATALELDKAFSVSKDNAITANAHFITLEKAGHDISMWVNYETLSSEFMNPALTGGLALSASLVKDAAMAIGIDFEKGCIKGEMLYYMSDEMKEICKEMGKQNTDKDLIARFPAEQLNVLAGWHMDPGVLKKAIDKMGVTGLMNAGLAETGINTDNIFAAIGGDMGLALNNFSSKNITIPADSLYPGQQEYKTSDADIDYTFSLKIGSKPDFDKLLNFALQQKILSPATNGIYFIPLVSDSMHLVINDKYLVVSNSHAMAANYQNGSYIGKNKIGSDIVTQHPGGAYFNVKSMFNNINSNVFSADGDTSMINITRDLLDNVTFYGGENKGNTFEYHAFVNFSNKNENSLLQIINYAGKLQQAAKDKQVALKH